MACRWCVFIPLVTTTMLTPLVQIIAPLGQAHAQRPQDFLDARDGQRGEAVGFDDFVDAYQLDEVVSFRLDVRLRRLSLRLLATLGRRARCRSEEHTSELQSRPHLVCRLLLEKKKKILSQ